MSEADRIILEAELAATEAKARVIRERMGGGKVPRLADDARPRVRRPVKPKMPSQADLHKAGVTSLDMVRAQKDLAS